MPRIDSKEIEYKEKKVKGMLDRVTAVLTGSKSMVFTKIAKRYKEIDDAIENLKEEREKLNEDVKNKVADLHDAEHDIITRVVETVSMTATLAKRTPASVDYVEDFDSEGAFEELYELLPELVEKLDYIKEKYTVIHKIEKAEKSPQLRVKFNQVDESVADDKLEEYASLVKKKVELSLRSFDQKFSALQAKI